jgi:beta-lactamase class A
MLIAATLALLSAAPPASPIDAKIAARVAAFRGEMGVAAFDPAGRRWITLNADARFPTASAIKTAVMVEVFHRIAAGSLRRDQLVTLEESDKVGGSGVLHSLRAGAQYSVADLQYLMIALSDNTATNMLLELVGARAVTERMEAYGLRETRLYRPSFRGGRAEIHPEEEREFGLGSSTPREMARLMALIAEGRAVSREASEEMLALLRKQQSREMIPRLLPGAEAGVTVANKMGQDTEKLADGKGRRGAVRVDAAIVDTPKGRYVIAIFARRTDDTRWSVDNEAYVAGAEISRLVYQHFTAPQAP